VIYLHGNSSSRRAARSLLTILVPLNISVFVFDFSGCGHSEGKYISLGYFEKDDLKVVVKFLRQSGKVSTIGL